MASFRKMPVVIEAIKWNGFTVGLTNGGEFPEHLGGSGGEPAARLEMPEWMPPISRVVTDEKWPGAVPEGAVWRDGDDLWIGTLEGPHKASAGDWIIRGMKGELYPCKPDIFEATYERVPEVAAA